MSLQLIAQQGSTDDPQLVLILINSTSRQGFMYDRHQRQRTPTMHVDAFLKRGYWQEPVGSMTTAELLAARKAPKV